MCYVTVEDTAIYKINLVFGIPFAKILLEY